MFEVTIRAVFTVPIPPCPVMADARRSRRVHASLRRTSTKVSLVRFSLSLPLGCPLSSPLSFWTPFHFSLAQTKSSLPCCRGPFPNIRWTCLADWVSADVVGFSTTVTGAVVWAGLIVPLEDREDRVPRMFSNRLTQILPSSFL